MASSWFVLLEFLRPVVKKDTITEYEFFRILFGGWKKPGKIDLFPIKNSANSVFCSDMLILNR